MDVSLIDQVPWQVLIDYHIWVVEVVEQKHAKISRKRGYSPGGIVIEDLSGLGWGHAHQKVLQLLATIASIDDNYFPAILRKFYIINAPSIFTMMWKVVQSVLSARTLAKFEILGCDKEQHEALFHKLIPDKYLPDYLGGKSPFKMPVAGYQPELIQKLPKLKYDIEVSVLNGDTFVHSVPITEPSIVRWSFLTKDYDISFRLVFKSTKGVEKELVPLIRVQSQLIGQSGAQLIEEVGTCAFVFDNTYSYWYAKQLSLNTNVVPATKTN